MSFVFLFSTEIDPNYFILHCSVSLCERLLIIFQTIFWIKIFSRQKHCNIKRIWGSFSVSHCSGSDQVFLLALTLKRMSSYNSSSTAYLRYWLLTEQSPVVVKLFERFWAFDAPDNLLKLFQPVLSSPPGRAVTSPLGAARFPVSLTLLAANDATTSQLCRRLHQRKQNFEIYKFLKQQILVKTEEVKVLREKEKELKTFKRNVRKCSYQTKLVLLLWYTTFSWKTSSTSVSVALSLQQSLQEAQNQTRFCGIKRSWKLSFQGNLHRNQTSRPLLRT